MRAVALEISPNIRAKRPNKNLDNRIRAALAEHFRRKYPANGPKLMARDYGMSIDMARDLLEGSGSLNSLDRILTSTNGGWPEILPVLGMVIGESLDQHISKQRSEHAEQDRRRDALLRALRAGNDAGASAGH